MLYQRNCIGIYVLINLQLLGSKYSVIFNSAWDKEDSQIL